MFNIWIEWLLVHDLAIEKNSWTEVCTVIRYFEYAIIHFLDLFNAQFEWDLEHKQNLMGFLDRPKVGPHLVFYCHNSTVLYEFLWESKMKSPVIIKGRRRNHFLLKVWPSWNKQEVSFLWKVMMSISVEMWWTFKSEQKWFPYQGEIDFDHLHHHDHHRKKPSKRPPSYFKRTEKKFL